MSNYFLKNRRKLSKAIVSPLSVEGHPLRSNLYRYKLMSNGIKVIEIDENLLIEKLESLLVLLD